MSRVLLLCVAACSIPVPVFPAKPNQNLPPKSHDISDPDAYAFYSSLFKTEGLNRPGETVAIFLGQMPFVPSFHCDRPLPKEEQTMVERSKANDRIAQDWKRQFDFAQPYLLVPPLDFFHVRNCVFSLQDRHPLPGCESYVNVRSLLYLSIPVFNSDHSKALVTVERVSFDERPDGGFLKIFRKTTHGWIYDSHGLAGCKWSFLTDQ